MVFSSIEFIYFFLPLALLLYYMTPRQYKNYTLTLTSLVFYSFGEPKYILLLIASSLVDFYHGKLIVKYRGQKKAKRALIQSIIINLSMLIFFKYADFIIEIMNIIFNSNIALMKIDLPIGISFFTFQTMSYTIDIYREEGPLQKNILNLATYVTLFPQLIAGPIVRYNTLSKALTHRKHTFEKFSEGVERFVIGLMKKILIANVIGEAVEAMALLDHKTVLIYWMMAIGYSLQIYFDFSGYSDMAIGLGLFFGFEFMENFNYPYVSKSITEFWRRWHISLGQWFRDYLYIPLGGNRVSRLRWFLNIGIVWFLTGLWHGAHLNFIIWGLYFGIILMVEKLVLLDLLKKSPKLIQHLYVILIVTLSFVIFKYQTLAEVTTHLRGLFAFGQISVIDKTSSYYFMSYYRIFIVSILAATPLIKISYQSLIKSRFKDVLSILRPIFFIGMLLLMTGYLVDATFNPFLYFRF